MVDKNKAVVCCLLATSAMKGRKESVKCGVRSGIGKGIQVYHAMVIC
jgi:hypothetical protein